MDSLQSPDPAKNNLVLKDKIQTSLDEGKVKELVASRHTLKFWLRDMLQTKRMINERIFKREEGRRKHRKEQKYEYTQLTSLYSWVLQILFDDRKNITFVTKTIIFKTGEGKEMNGS